MTRHLAIGDIHGCFDALRRLEHYVGFRDDDTIVTLGDYVDRGPNSCAVVDWLIHMDGKHRLVPLRGNHEVMMLDARRDEDKFHDWLSCGGRQTLESYAVFEGDPGALVDVPERHWDFLRDRLAPAYEIETHFFVHANAHPETPLDDQPPFLLYWQPFVDPDRHQSGKMMVCGHTAQRSGLPLANENAVCIDTRAHAGGWLTCLHVESGQIWQANEAGDTRSFHLDEVEDLKSP